MAKKAATRAEREHMGRVAALGCGLCRLLGFPGTPAELHHPRTGVGIGKRSAHTDVIPLCFHHHRGNVGVHGMGRKAFEREYGVTEMKLLEETKRLLSGNMA
jgi:hypothetical protein